MLEFTWTARTRTLLLVLLLIAGLAATMPTEQAEAATAAERTSELADDDVHPEVERRMQGRGKRERVRVIVSLDVPGRAAKWRQSDIRSARNAVLGALPAGSYGVRARFDRIPAVSLAVDANALDALARNPRVTAVNEDHEIALSDAESHAVTGSDVAHGLGFSGNGTTVAVIDSGVDVTDGVVHPGLADDLLSQACFRTENDCAGGATSAQDQHGHGTHVSGIITGPGGVAPEAKFHALKVFTAGSTTDTNILNALDRVILMNLSVPGSVDLVNMSLGGGIYSTAAACDAAHVPYVNAFASLNSQGTAVVVATGNDAVTTGVGSPSCVTGAIGVGSVGDGVHSIGFNSCTDTGAPDKVSCYSNTTAVQGDGELVDLLAPGCRLSSLWLNGGAATICGTSMATPYAVGVAALVVGHVKSRGEGLGPVELESLLEATGESVLDYRLVDGPSFPRVRTDRAVEAVLLRGVPDGRIKKTSGPLAGNDVYGGAKLQTVSSRVRPRRAVSFIVTAQNDAEVAERLRLKASASSRRFVVNYLDKAGTNVTRRIVAGTLRTSVLSPGQVYRLTVVVKPRRTAPRGATIRRPVTAFSTEVPTAKDVVAFKVRRR